MWPLLLTYCLGQVMTYPLQTWPAYPQAPREYPDDDYYYAPKVQYYYDAPAIAVPDVYGQMPYTYFYDPYGHFANEAPKRQEERLAALPIGQETWFENDAEPNWRSSNVDDVNAAFLDNLILTQMAQDAQRRRENARAAFPTPDYDDRDDTEDEDVKELKALAGKPLYHVPKTVPKVDEDDYENDDADSFINWNGNKRSVSTVAPAISTESPETGDKEIMVPRPALNTSPQHYHSKQNRKNASFYKTIAKLLDERRNEGSTPRRIDKRFVAADSDLVVNELRELKNHIAT